MKKTLIALLALGGLAMAEEEGTYIEATSGAEFNTEWPTTLQTVHWQKGDTYWLELYVTGGLPGAGGVVKLADNLYLINQKNDEQNVNRFFGVNYTSSNNLAGGWRDDWDFSIETGTLSTTRVMTTDSTGNVGAWTMNEQGTGSGYRTWGGMWGISITGEAGQTTIDYMYNGGTVSDRFVLPRELNLTDIQFVLDNVTLEGGMLVVNHNVPEPTTGTLSLLALAGLCIRRRK